MRAMAVALLAKCRFRELVSNTNHDFPPAISGGYYRVVIRYYSIKMYLDTDILIQNVSSHKYYFNNIIYYILHIM